MVAVAPSSHDLASTLARDWAFQVDTTDGSVTPNWVFVRGLSQFAPVTNLVMQDDSDIDNEGYQSQIPTADPGQAHLRAKGEETGFENMATVRFWRTDGVQSGAYEALVSVQFEPQAGGNEDLDSFTITMMTRGKPIAITPVADADGASVPVV